MALTKSVHLLAFFCGFLSLSAEILWVRLYGFSQHSIPQAFGFVLFCFILGIALGAFIGKKYCEVKHLDDELWEISSIALIINGIFLLLFPLIFGYLGGTAFSTLGALVLITINATVVAIIFPIVHHLGANNKNGVGRMLSNVYFSNVLGATLGPLVTGYLVLDILTLQEAFFAFFLISIFIGLLVLEKHRLYVLLGLIIFTAPLGWETIQRPHAILQSFSDSGDTYKSVIETRQGIITIFKDEALGDAVFGGNVYDGRVNLNGDVNSNKINRILLTSALQPKPKKVLMIGLSIGTWLALVREFKGIEKIDVIEINPGYEKAITNYPDQLSATQDPRVNIIYDDGRRWLKANKSEKYDLVIMNTTWNWRSYSTLLLSKEFLSIVKRHLNPRAIFCFNTTGSDDAFYTAAHVFDHAYRYLNFVYVSDHDFRESKDTQEALDMFRNFSVNNQMIFKENSDIPKHMLEIPFVSIQDVESKAGRNLEVITDMNMITEFKYGKKLFN
ncbi:MAG: hypothetical protein ACAH12_03750 [Methylophilaceae bacterium]